MPNPVYIYGLRSKEQSRYSYVGQTSHPSSRLQQHLHDVANGDGSSTPKSTWIEGVMQSNGEIVMDILEECDSSDAANRELHWIKAFISAGHQLTNSSLVAQAKFQLYIQDLYNNKEPVITDADLDGELAEHFDRIETALFQNGNVLQAICAKFSIPLPPIEATDRQ